MSDVQEHGSQANGHVDAHTNGNAADPHLTGHRQHRHANTLPPREPNGNACVAKKTRPADQPECSHASGRCSYLDSLPDAHLHEYDWCPANETIGDQRSPCPALNVLANHGYLPRNGQKIGIRQLAWALREVYGLSWFLSFFLSIGARIVMMQWNDLSLGDLSRHNHIEHDASIVHHNIRDNFEYAPWQPDEEMYTKLWRDVDEFSETRPVDPKNPLETQALIDLTSIARTRVRREAMARRRPIDAMHSEIAKGEMSLFIGIFSRFTPTCQHEPKTPGATTFPPFVKKSFFLRYFWWLCPAHWIHKDSEQEILHRGVSREITHQWFIDEELPADWIIPPPQKQTFWRTFWWNQILTKRMAIYKAEMDASDDPLPKPSPKSSMATNTPARTMSLETSQLFLTSSSINGRSYGATRKMSGLNVMTERQDSLGSLVQVDSPTMHDS